MGHMAKAIQNRYRCDSCAWVYDPAAHEEVDLDAQADDWACPNCQAARDHFQLVVPVENDVVESEEPATQAVGRSAGPIRRVATHESDPDLASLYRRISRGKLVTQPDFQRYEVWSVQKQSRLIESILLDLPIPTIYTAEEPDGNQVVVNSG